MKQLLKQLWTPWMLLISLFLAVLVCIGAWLFLYFTWPVQSSLQTDNSAQVTIISAQTFTPSPEISYQETQSMQETQVSLPDFFVGRYVQISGTGNTGLNIRSGAGLSASTNFVGLDTEVFQILDGPVEADGFIWWFLTSPYDENRSGWAVEDFLDVVEQ